MRIPWKAVKRIGFLGLVSYLLISLWLNKILGWSFPDPKVSVVDQEAEIDYRVSDLGSVSLNMIGEKVAAKVYDTAVKRMRLTGHA